MFLFKKNYYRTNEIVKWLFCTIFLSALPIVISIMTAFNMTQSPKSFGAIVNVNDFIFMGLTITISNLNAWRSGLDEEISDIVVFSSVGCLILLSVYIGQAYSVPVFSIASKAFASVLVLIPVIISLEITLRNSKQNNMIVP